MGYQLDQSRTTTSLVFLMISSDDHLTGKAGITPTVTISKNGGAFAAPSGVVSEIGNGWYKLVPAAADTNTVGPLILHATGSGADPTDDAFEVVSLVDGKTVQEAFQICAAVLAGKILTAGQPTEIFYGLDGASPRVSVAVDQAGNRSLVTYS